MCGNPWMISGTDIACFSYQETTSSTLIREPRIRGFGPPAPSTISMCSVLTSMEGHLLHNHASIIPPVGRGTDSASAPARRDRGSGGGDSRRANTADRQCSLTSRRDVPWVTVHSLEKRHDKPGTFDRPSPLYGTRVRM